MSASIVHSQNLTITEPNDLRVVEGADLADAVAFPIANSSENDLTVDWGLATGSTGTFLRLEQPSGSTSAPATPWLGSTLDSSASGTLFARPDLTGITAGNTVSFGITGTPSGGSVVDQSLNINVVQNRVLTGFQELNVGRHIVGLQPLGTLTLRGGSQTGSEATSISIHSGGNAQFSNGIRLSSATDFTFDGANQTHDLQVAYNGPVGDYSVTDFAFPGAGAITYTTPTGERRIDFGGAWNTSAEYGSLTGEKRTIVEENPSDWANNRSRQWSTPQPTNGNTNLEANFGVYREELVETPQIVIPTTVPFRDPVSDVVTDLELERGAGALVNQRINPLITGEANAVGSDLDLSGVSLTVNGTAVTDRQIFRGVVDLGRRMLNSPDEVISQSDMVALRTFGNDETRTRIALGPISDSSVEGLTVEHIGTANFNSASSSTDIEVTADFVLDTSVRGEQTRVLNIAPALTGEGLANEQLQSFLSVGYKWNNLEDNQLRANDLLVIDEVGEGLGTALATVSNRFSTTTHTNLSSDRAEREVSRPDLLEQGVNDRKTNVVRAISEGLAGENMSGVNRDAVFRSAFVGVTDAEISFTQSNGEGIALSEGDSITLSDTGLGVFQKHTILREIDIAGSDNLDFEVRISGGDAVIDHGSSRTITVEYVGAETAPSAGSLDRIERAILEVETGQAIDPEGIANTAGFSVEATRKWTSSKIDTARFNLEQRFEAPAAETASSTAASGADLGKQGVGLSNTTANTSSRFAAGTQASLLDSEILQGETTITVTFEKVEDGDMSSIGALENSSSNAASLAGIFAATPNSKFASDIVNLNGLDGKLHVLEIDFDPASVGADESAQLLWETSYDNNGVIEVAWVNAVLGNSDITELDLLTGMLTTTAGMEDIADYLFDRRHESSYLTYLEENGLTEPELGAWGVDLENSKVWATIDHNSKFAAAVSGVPEPSSAMLLLGAAFGFVNRRRR